MPFTSILYMCAAPGRRDDLVAAFRRLRVLETASEQEGFVSSTLHLSLEDPDELMVSAIWTTRDAYEGWLANPKRERLGEDSGQLIADDGVTGRVFAAVHSVRA